MYDRAAEFADLEYWLRGLYLGALQIYITKSLTIGNISFISCGFIFGVLGVFLLFY